MRSESHTSYPGRSVALICSIGLPTGQSHHRKRCWCGTEVSRGHCTVSSYSTDDRKDRTLKNKDEHSLISNRGGWSARQTDPVPRPGSTASATRVLPALRTHCYERFVFGQLCSAACCYSGNRLVRIRMLGGVGRVASDGGPYPISPTYFLPDCAPISACASRASSARAN